MTPERESRDNLFYKWWVSPLEDSQRSADVFQRFHEHIRDLRRKSKKGMINFRERYPQGELPYELKIFAPDESIYLALSYEEFGLRKSKNILSKVELRRSSDSHQIVNFEVLGIAGTPSDFLVKFANEKGPLVKFYTARRALVNFFEKLNAIFEGKPD